MACNPLNQKLAVKNPPTFCGNSPNLRNSQAHYIGGFLTKASEAPGAFSNGKIPGMSGMSRFEKAEDQRRAEAKDILTLRIWCQFILKFRTGANTFALCWDFFCLKTSWNIFKPLGCRPAVTLSNPCIPWFFSHKLGMAKSHVENLRPFQFLSHGVMLGW